MNGENLDGRKLITFVFVVESCKAIIDVSIIHKRFVDSFEKQSLVASDKHVGKRWARRRTHSNAINLSVHYIELSNIRTILINNCYPGAITKKMNQFRRPTQLDPQKCPVYLHLPWLGNVSMRYEMKINTAVKRYYFAVEPCIVCTTR